jgi:hypothetical protein
MDKNRMNDRTLTHNLQIDQLITTITPKSAPVPLVSTWHQLHENAIATMKIANVHCAASEPDQTLCELRDGILVMVVILVCFLIFVKPRK